MNRRTLSIGDTGDDVRAVQQAVGAKPDGVFGPLTRDAVEAFQGARNLYADGIVGPVTWAAIEPTDALEHIRVEADPYEGGYNRFTLRADMVARYEALRAECRRYGIPLTSSGSKRPLTADVSPSRSATSMHYLLRAFDLYVYSGMADIEVDPYLVELDGDRRWTVWARSEAGEEREINAVSYRDREGTRVTARVVNLTDIMARHGWQRIRARSSFFRGGARGGAEWWHFECRDGLIDGETTFGEELQRTYELAELQHTPPWRFAHYIWNGSHWSAT